MAHRVHNFNAGPAALPLSALERARDELIDYDGTGMSIIEHSHRGKDYEKVHAEAIALLRELAGIPDTHAVLFLQGGASQQFATIPMNFLPQGKSADYVLTGVWGEKALAEAQILSRVRIAATTGPTFHHAPSDAEISIEGDAAYVHYTTNETIHGVQFHHVPDAHGRPLLCDMSSDILSRPLDVAKHALIYAGAQKNIGPSGLVVVIVDKALAAAGRKDIPKIFRYQTHVENDSLYNTAPTFSVYLMRNVLVWLKEKGGLAAMAAENRKKAETLYGAIDENEAFYRAPVRRDSRSEMNVVFRLPTPELEERFVKEAKAADMVGLKGHRSVGGIRVSLYNAVALASVEVLAAFMREFVRRAG
jgi:phosphoserine aminotransferase